MELSNTKELKLLRKAFFGKCGKTLPFLDKYQSS